MAVYIGFELVLVLVLLEVVGESYLDMYALRLAIMSGDGEKIDMMTVAMEGLCSSRSEGCE